jgi:prepilin-type N-terminal cleavage/methylation domain-containing protein
MRITIRTTPLLRQTRFYAAAFSLLELLVVISIIAVLMTIGSYGIKNFSKASGVSAAIPIAQGVFSQARSLAIEKGTDTRVLIHADNDTVVSLNRERNLRYMVVQYLDTKDTEVTTDDEWITASKGIKIPEGVFYSVSLSGRGTAPNLTGQLNMPPPHEPLQTVRQVDARLPGQASGQDSNCYQYRFNSQGIIIDPYPDIGTAYVNNVPRFVIRAGSLPPGTAEPIPASGAGERNAGGFVIWKNGRTAVFRHPDQIFF